MDKFKFFQFSIGVGIFILAVNNSVARADHPACDQIQDACGASGYTRGVPGSKDLMSKCFQPIMSGEKLPDVKVDPDLVKKCTREQTAHPKQSRHHSLN